MFQTTNQIVIFRGLLDDGSYDGFLMCFDCFLDPFLMVVCGLWMNITKSCVSCCPEYLNFVGGKIPTLLFFHSRLCPEPENRPDVFRDWGEARWGGVKRFKCPCAHT